MTFGESIRSVLSQYVTFSGRASRSEFWWFFLFLFLANVVLQIIDTTLDASVGHSGVGTLFGLAVLLPSLAVSVRRLHDSSRSGWWLLGLAIAYVAGGMALAGGALGGLFAALSDGTGSGTESDGLIAVFVVVAAAGALVLLATLVLWIVQMTRASDPGVNRYGPHPLLPVAFPGPAVSPDAPGQSPWGGARPPTYPG